MLIETLRARRCPRLRPQSAVLALLLVPPLLAALVGVTACGGPPAPPADDAAGVADSSAPGLGLPPRHLQVLRQEMVQIEGASKQLLGYLVRGQQQAVADTARRIHDSFILKRELSQEQLEELVSLLPPGFVERDRAFHATAAELAGAAAAGDLGRASDLYAELTRACVDCHATFARHRFPFPPPEGPAGGDPAARGGDPAAPDG